MIFDDIRFNLSVKEFSQQLISIFSNKAPSESNL